MIRVGIVGAAGKVGRVMCSGLAADPDLELVAAIDPSHAGEPVEGTAALTVAPGLEALVDARVDVAVDFTRPDAVMETIRFGVTNGIHLVVGTTGIGPAELERIQEWVEDAEVNVVVAPNFSLGAAVAQRLAEVAAGYFPAAEIIELHHDQKVDAPSGTAAATARRLAAARGDAWAGPAEEALAGVRGGQVEGIRVHSVRLPGLVAHQEVLFGGQGQLLSIRHDATDRTSYLPGVLLAVKEVAKRPGLTVGLEPLLDR